MSYCLNPDCKTPQNPDGAKFCQRCGSRLLLGERYCAVRPIAQGGFGRTFLAVDYLKPSQPYCVIKQFFLLGQSQTITQKAAQLFQEEALRLDQLGQHPQIPALLARCEQDQRQYLVQEYIDGENLAEESATRGAFSDGEIRSLLDDLLPVLQFIHEGQVIHRDLKPENVIRRRIDHKLVLVDFGAAKYASSTALAKTGTSIGSAGYAAPEQSFGKAVFASDLYSLGIMCLHLLTQVEPFDLFDVSESTFMWRDYLGSNPVSDDLGRVLDRLIQSVVRLRYPSAQEVLRDLQSPKPIQPPPSVPPQYRRQSILPPEPILATDTLLKHPNQAVQASYTRLRLLLAAGNWREANRETKILLLQLVGRNPQDKLKLEDIAQMTCEDLGAIDQLWVNSSGDRFGFSIQRRIWVSLGGERNVSYRLYYQFADRVEWRVSGHWVSATNLSINLNNREGQFPLLPEMFGFSASKAALGFLRVDWCRSFFDRIGSCHL